MLKPSHASAAAGIMAATMIAASPSFAQTGADFYKGQTVTDLPLSFSSTGS
jgi:hypothetical protein